MLDKETYKREYIRMMDSTRIDHKGRKSCIGIHCDECNIKKFCNNYDNLAFNAFEIIETVEKWAKEHPIVTKADKFKEVFGVEPKDNSCDDFICPRYLGFSVHECYSQASCRICEKNFWLSEYKEPGKEKE